MQWLLHGDIRPAVAEALRRRGDTVHIVAELGDPVPRQPAEVIQAAHRRQWDIITADAGLARAPFETPVFFDRAIVYLQLESAGADAAEAIDRLFERYRRLAPRRLYTVTPGRVKVRQLPARQQRKSGQ